MLDQKSINLVFFCPSYLNLTVVDSNNQLLMKPTSLHVMPITIVDPHIVDNHGLLRVDVMQVAIHNLKKRMHLVEYAAKQLLRLPYAPK